MTKSLHQISFQLDQLIKHTLGIECLVNPFFRISKITPEQTRRYRILTENHSMFFYFIISISIFIVNMIKNLLYIICSFATVGQYFLFSKSNRKFDVIFLSHAIGANISAKPGDQFFGLMPNYLALQKYKVAIFYTNHDKRNYLSNSRTLRMKNSGIDTFLCPKFLLPQENLEFLFNSFKLTVKCLKIGLKKLKGDPDQTKLLMMAVPYFFGRGAYSNFLLKKRCLEVRLSSKSKFFILTLEGHSYEEMIFDSLSELEPKCKTIFYQHSPLVPGHLGLINFLQGQKFELQILVTGTIYKEFLEQFISSSNIQVLGSQKANTTSISGNLKNTILFAPEGTVQATLQFIHLVREMLQRDKNRKYVLRLHPNLQSNMKIKFYLKKLNKNENFCISKSTLVSDLETSSFVFYRSSAVGIEALLYKTHLVFYGNNQDSAINPLLLIGSASQEASGAKEALDVLDSTIKEVDTLERAIAYDKMFSRIEYSKLLSAIENY
jgi:hypothetical protein